MPVPLHLMAENQIMQQQPLAWELAHQENRLCAL